VTQLVLPLHECVDEPLQDDVESVADPATIEATTNHVVVESAAETLQYVVESVVDPATVEATTDLLLLSLLLSLFILLLALLVLVLL
jgi:hypothetical protein